MINGFIKVPFMAKCNIHKFVCLNRLVQEGRRKHFSTIGIIFKFAYFYVTDC